MRWLIDYIRSCFCKHEFQEYIGDMYKHYGFMEQSILTTKCTLICKKCGFKKSHWIGD